MSLTITAQQLKDPILLKEFLEQQKNHFGFKDFIQLNLMRACKLGGLTKSVEILLSYGAIPDGYDTPVKETLHLQNLNITNTPLQYCVINDDRDSVNLLLTQKADPNVRGIKGTVENPDDVRLNLPPLHLATRHGHRSMVEILLASGGSQTPLPETGEYPIHIAAREGHVHLLNLFCTFNSRWVDKRTERPAQIIDNSFTSKTPLHISVEHAHIDCVQALIDQFDAGINVEDSRGNNSLHLLLLNSPRDQNDSNIRYAIALALLKTDIDLNNINNDGFTPLDLAANNGYPKIAQLLYSLKGVSGISSRKSDENEKDESFDKLSLMKRSKSLEDSQNKKQNFKETLVCTKPSVSVPHVPSKTTTNNSPNLDNEISSFSISTKDSSERMYISFDKNQTPKSIANQTNNISNNTNKQTVFTESKPPYRDVPFRYVRLKTENNSLPRPEGTIREPNLRSRIHTSKVTTVIKETTFWKSAPEDQLRQYYYIPKPEIDKELPVFGPQKLFFPKRRRSLSPVSFMSEGQRRGLKFRVMGRVPKAYNKNDKESARKEFILHPPIGIESFQESADRTHLSIVSLPDFQTKDDVWLKSIERRMQWLETFQKLKWRSDITLDPNKKYLSSNMESKFMGQDKIRGKLIGFYPLPYKSFGPIEIKTDALEQAMEEYSDYEEECWDIRKSYNEHYPITNWVKNDGQRICPMEINDESFHSGLKQPDEWSNDESDKEQDPKRSSCCSITIDDVIHVVQIADIDDNQIKDISKVNEEDIQINIDRNKNSGVTTTMVTTYPPEIKQKETFQLVDVNIDEDENKNVKQPILPEVSSSKSKVKGEGKLVKKRTQKNIVQTTAIEFIKDYVPQIPPADKKMEKIKSDKSEESTTITRKTSNERSDKKLKKSVSQEDKSNIPKTNENEVQDKDTHINKNKLKDEVTDKFEQNINDRTSNERSDKKELDSTTTTNLETSKQDNQNKDGIVIENSLVDVDNGEMNEGQLEGNQRLEKPSKPKSKAHGAHCVRVKKKTRPSLDNIVNPSGNWTQAIIDNLFLSDKWKDDQDIDNEITSYKPRNDDEQIVEINRNVEGKDKENFNIEQKDQNIVKIPVQDKKESNLDDGEVINEKNESIINDFENSSIKNMIQGEVIGKSDKKKKRTTKVATTEIEDKILESKVEGRIQVIPKDSKQVEKEIINIPDKDDTNLENSDVNREKVRIKDSKKTENSDKITLSEKGENITLTPTIDKDKSNDIQTKDDIILPDSDKNESNAEDLEIISPKRKGSMEKKKRINDSEIPSPKEENDDKNNIDPSTSSEKRKKSRSKSVDISNVTKVKDPEHDEGLYLSMSKTNKDEKMPAIVSDETTGNNLQDSKVTPKKKVKRNDSKTRTKTDKNGPDVKENILLTDNSDQIEKLKQGEENTNNLDMNIEKKRGGSKRKSKVDKGGLNEQDVLYTSTQTDADQIEMNEENRNEDFKKREKINSIIAGDNKFVEKPNEDSIKTTANPTQDNSNNLDVLIPIELPSSDGKTSRPSKRSDKVIKDKVGIKSNLDKMADVTLIDDSKTLDKNSIPNKETSDHQYYNISDLPARDSCEDKRKEAYDEITNDSKGKSKDGVNFNKSKETNVDIEEPREGKKKKLKKKKSETTLNVKKEAFIELPKRSDDFPPTEDLSIIQDEPALSDSDFNSSDPDASQYVEYHVSLGPDYSGKSRIKKAKSMDSENNLKETEKMTEEREIQIKDRHINKDGIHFDPNANESKLKTRNDSNNDISKNKTKKKYKNPEYTLESTTTETTEIQDQEVRKKTKAKKTKNGLETNQNERGKVSQFNNDGELYQNSDKGSSEKDKLQDKELKLEDHKAKDQRESSREKVKETVNEKYLEEIGSPTMKKQNKSKTPTQLSDDVGENLPYPCGNQNYSKKLEPIIQNNNDGGIETNLDDDDNEKFVKNTLKNEKNSSIENLKDDHNQTTEVTETTTVEIIENYDDGHQTTDKIKKKKSKRVKKDEIAAFFTNRVDLIELNNDGTKMQNKTEVHEDLLKGKEINEDDLIEETSGKRSKYHSEVMLEDNIISEKEIDKEENEISKKKKRGKDNYPEETVATTEALIENNLKLKKDKNIEGITRIRDKEKTKIMDGAFVDKILDEDNELRKNKLIKGKRYKDGYLEDTRTITKETVIEDNWKYKGKKSNTEETANTIDMDRKKLEFNNTDEVVIEEISNEERIRNKSKKNKNNKYLKETTIEDQTSKQDERNSQEMSITSDKGRKENELNNKDENLVKEIFDEDDDHKRSKSKKYKKPKDDYLEDITTTTTVVENRWNSKHRRRGDLEENSSQKESSHKEESKVMESEEIMDEKMSEVEDKEWAKDAKSIKVKNNKKGQNDYLEVTTSTTETIIEDDIKSKQRMMDKYKINNIQDQEKTSDKLNKDFISTTDEEVKKSKKNKRKNGYLEDTTTTTILFEENERSKEKFMNKFNSFENDDKRKFIETDFDCQEPLPPSTGEGKDFTPGSKPPLKRNIPPLIHKNQQNMDQQISSPMSSDQDYSTQPLSITLPNLLIEGPKDDDSPPRGGRIPRQYSSAPKYYEEETKETTETTTIDTLRWHRRPRRKTRSVSFESIPRKQFQDKPLNSEIPDKTLQQAAFEMLQQNQAEVWRKSWKTTPVVYTRGVYKPQQPLYKRDMVGENIPGKTDESRISQVFLPSLDDSRIGSVSPDKGIEKSPDFSTDEINFTDEDEIDDEHRTVDDESGHMANFPANLSPYSKSFSPFIYNSLTRKVTYVKPLRRKRQYNSLSLYPIRGTSNMNQSVDLPPHITEPGPVDFTKYGYLSKLWMECVDKKTVQKSDTMYLSVLPTGSTPLDSLENTLLRRYLQRSGGTAEHLKDSKDGSQWVIARGRSVRLAKRKWMEQKENMLGVDSAGMSFYEGSPNRSTINQSFANHPSSMLFFKVDQINWPDLAWILFDGIQSDAETVRTIADVRLKHQDDAGAQIRDLMSRWWLKKGDAATIEELQNALEFVRIPYVQEEDENASFFYPVRESDEDELDEDFGNRNLGRAQQLMIQEVSENDPDISRMMIEYGHKSPNASYVALTGPQFNKEYDSSKKISTSNLQVPSMRESRQSLGSIFKDKFRLSSSSLQKSHSNLPSKQISFPMDSSVNLGSQSSFRVFSGGLIGRKSVSKEEPVIEVSTADDQDNKTSFKSKGQISSFDLESNL